MWGRCGRRAKAEAIRAAMYLALQLPRDRQAKHPHSQHGPALCVVPPREASMHAANMLL